MLFEATPYIMESEKERNLYYKFFAGYFFNELVLGYQNRVNRFLERHIFNSPQKFGPKIALNFSHANKIYITFDYHAYLIDEKSDRGEVADVLLFEPKDDLIISIEAKFLTDWKFEKDVLKNLERLKLFKNKNKIQCLLITEQKLKNSLNKINQPRSNFKKLIDNQAILEFPFIILTWEALIRDCENQNIKAFFENHLKKRKDDFRKNMP